MIWAWIEGCAWLGLGTLGMVALFYVAVLVFSWLLAKIVDEDVWSGPK